MGQLHTACFLHARSSVQRIAAQWLCVAAVLGMATIANARPNNAASDPFRIDGKPPAVGYLSHSPDQIEKDLLEIPMIAQIASVFATIEPRSYSTLRRAISRDPVSPDAIDDQSLTAYLHLARGTTHVALEVHSLENKSSKKTIALRSVQSPDQIWGIDAGAFDRIGIDWPAAESTNASNQEVTIRGQSTFELPHPYVQSETLLDLRTVRARFKHSYPRLSRELEKETIRIRLPKYYKPGFPAGVLVWISPMPDGRIPQIFEQALDQHGLIAIGVDNNGNQRQLTDRLQNHLDSIESVAAHYRIDRQRIYLTGMSGGGRCSGILQFAFPDLFAGAVPIVGLDTYHNAPTGDPGKFWPARLAKPAGRWMRLLKERRIAGITGTADFNQPEMSIRQGLLKDDGIDMRLDIIEGMAHTMPTSAQFASALDWVDEPRRDSMVESFKEAKSLMAQYTQRFGESQPTTPAARKSLIKIITLAPYTDPAWEAAAILGYDRQD